MNIAEKWRFDFMAANISLHWQAEVGHLTDSMTTLDEIVSAAAKVFRTKGYHAATVRDIADEVGILKGSLYHHFDSKEELLYLVVKEPIAQMYRTISEIAAADGTARKGCGGRSRRISKLSTDIIRTFSCICASAS